MDALVTKGFGGVLWNLLDCFLRSGYHSNIGKDVQAMGSQAMRWSLERARPKEGVSLWLYFT